MASVVVVEDEEDVRRVIVRLLRRAGHEVEQACNGKEGLDLVLGNPVDLVVSDIDMPVMDGIEMCRNIRGDARTRDLPILMVSGSLLPGDDRPLQAGATLVLTKPFAGPELLQCVAEALDRG
ncbi:response regulator [Actinoplanes sp. NBC_00393]|uniref:response regulator n=1 Tax=Actinoplanes sp. NBC_00393 TaxID=2975953 RepID=UPI002E1A6519